MNLFFQTISVLFLRREHSIKITYDSS